MGAVTTLSPTAITVEAGAQAVTTIRVRNTGSIVDRFDIDIVGVSGWVRVDPPSLSLFPGAEGSATVTFGPPRASTPRAGTIPFGVRVRPAADPKGSAVEEGRVTVVPFTAAAADIVPQTSRGSRAAHHQVLVDNRGNAPVEVVVTPIDPDLRLGFTVQPPRAVVSPEERVVFLVGVRVDDPFPFGPARPRQFQVNVEPGRQPPIQLRATLSQQGLFPAWLPRVVGPLLAAAALLAAAFAFGLGPFAPAASPAPSAVALGSGSATEGPSGAASAGASAEQSAEPSEEASGAGESASAEAPSASPSAPPLSPSDLTLAVTGDKVELGSGLQLACPATTKTCRSEAKEIVIAMVQELQNPYTGKGIVSTRTPSAIDTLPVIVSAKREVPWQQAGGGQAGVTESAVVDLGPLLASPPTPVYAVVSTLDGLPHRFVVDSGLAKQLFDKLYTLPPDMPPVVPVTPAPGVSLGDAVFAQPIWDRQWILSVPFGSPTP